MDTKWLKTFISAAKFENFREASEELFLTQPAVTKHIKRLEDHLRIQLFDRTGKHVSLTPAGYKFLPAAIKMIQKYEEEMEVFEGWKQGYNRKLIIAVAPQIAASALPSLLRSFIDQHPSIEVIINVVRSFEVGEEVSLGKADIGLSRMEPFQSDLSHRVIHRDPVILVAPFSMEIACESIMLEQYRLLTHNHPVYWNELLGEIKRYYPRIRTIPVTQMEVTKRFIESGLGISYVPFSSVQEELKNERMIEIKSDKIVPPISITYVVTKIETPEVTEFITFVETCISELY
jgi:LysR family transcriptional regulator, repressor for citA